ncbi:hypothetical protein M422DRAFT_257313 [Sphaerobolus stellatus SS14]|uniref:Uncharacterized protein n=1 Tax=Sphaerobolus stellatus (strain SS14) TaxID=990650 RepID=A0A0C9VF37_SPHS4|nr:hypothetical protein M422DRAFT_257313 [Sphaerobolus stellatus SS14]
MRKKSKAQLQREESLRKARNTLQASESLQIPAEVSETATEGSNNISGCADVVPAEEDVPEFMFDFIVESDDEEEIRDDSGMDGDIATRFMDAYAKGLNGTQAAWAAQKYHGHCVLPGNILKGLEEAQN